MEQIIYFDLIFVLCLLGIYFLAKKYQLFKNILIAVYLLSTLVYLVWRVGYTLPLNEGILSLIAGILLLVAEVGGCILSLVFYRMFINKNKRPTESLAKLKGQYPTVDIFIATYNEDEMILKRAILAARNLRYPQKEKVNVYVLDDGHREEIKQLAQGLNVHYLDREDHVHAKAGNLNNGLLHSQGELVVTMDADMVPREDFLERTIGYFANENLGFIQTPQTFFNHDPYQFNLFAAENIGNDQDFFMQSIEAQKDLFNATMYVGSNAIFRRQALVDIDGFATGVITEDMATGMLIQAKGWETRFVNENLASGLAPETFGDLIKQRDRWARGNIQVIRKWNPMHLKGLSWMQKVIYMDGIHYWVSGVYKMIFLLAPVLFLLFGIYSLKASLAGILLFWFPSFFASQLAFNVVSEGKQTVLLTNVYETVMAPYMSYAVIGEGLFKAKNKFVVTRKGVSFDKTYYNWHLAMPVLVLLGLTFLAFIKAVLVMSGVIPFAENHNAIYINVFWLGYNLIALILAAFMPFERPRFRKAERFTTDKQVQLVTTNQVIAGQLTDWNEVGAGIVLENQETILPETFDLVVDGYRIRCRATKRQGKVIGLIFEEVSEAAYSYILTQTYALASTSYQAPVKTNRVFRVLGKTMTQHTRRLFQR